MRARAEAADRADVICRAGAGQSCFERGQSDRCLPRPEQCGQKPCRTNRNHKAYVASRKAMAFVRLIERFLCRCRTV
jgi:hypothetical protein